MFTTYLRSSSYNCYDICQFQYYLSYVLGYKTESGIAATKGNILHKFLEYLALCKLAIQNKEKNLELDGIIIDLSNIPIDILFETSYNFYFHTNPKLSLKDKKECKKWIDKALSYQNGTFNPLNSEIIAVEHTFDIPIKKDWAKYDLTIGPNRYEGYYSVKGNIDLITKYSDKIYSLQDYKTGKRIKWGSGEKVKDFKYFQEEDFQLRLYYYALCHLYPDKDILITIYWVNDGNEFTIPFERSILPQIEETLKKRFETIKNNLNPKLLSWNRTDWRCKVLCKHGKNILKDNKSTCEHIRNELQIKGINKTTEEYLQRDPTIYGDGGGKLNV